MFICWHRVTPLHDFLTQLSYSMRNTTQAGGSYALAHVIILVVSGRKDMGLLTRHTLVLHSRNLPYAECEVS